MPSEWRDPSDGEMHAFLQTLFASAIHINLTFGDVADLKAAP